MAFKTSKKAPYELVWNDLQGILLNKQTNKQIKKQNTKWNVQHFVYKCWVGIFMFVLTCRSTEQPGRRN